MSSTGTTQHSSTCWLGCFILCRCSSRTFIWLGLGQVLFGLIGQVIVHGVIMNRKLKTLYNPGLVAVVLGHVPLGILYLMEVVGQGTAQ